MAEMDDLRIQEFEVLVFQYFDYLEREHGFSTTRAQLVAEDDPREKGVVVKYRDKAVRIEVLWGFAESIITIRLRLERNDVPRREHYIHLEPFVEFITEGQVKPIVPQVYRGMSEAALISVLRRRKQLLDSAFEDVIKSLATRLREYLNTILFADINVIHSYHLWLTTIGRQDRLREDLGDLGV